MWWVQSLLFLASSLFLAWRFAQELAEPDWALFNLWGFCGCKPYEEIPEVKPPGIFLWYRLLVLIFGKSVRRVKFAYHLVVNLGSLVALYAWGWPAALVYLTLINSPHLWAMCANVESMTALLLMVMLATKNPWFGAMAFAGACFFNLKAVVMFPALILKGWGFHIILPIIVGVFGVGIWAVVDITNLKAMLRAITIEARNVQKTRGSLKEWVDKQLLTNDCHWPSLGLTISWLLLAMVVKPDPLFWIAPLLYIILNLMGKTWASYHSIMLIPWIMVALQNFTLVWVLALGVLIMGSFYTQSLYWTGYRGLYDEARLAPALAKSLIGKKYWVNCWAHELYLYLHEKPKYGIDAQHGSHAFQGIRDRTIANLMEDPPQVMITGIGGGIPEVSVTARTEQLYGPFKIYEVIKIEEEGG